jgi:hypothetical protein
MGRFRLLITLAGVGAFLGIAPAAAGAQTQPTPEVTAFCGAALKADKASTAAFASGKKPSKKVQQELDAAFTEALNTTPPEVAANVQAAVTEVRNALNSGKQPSEDVLSPNIAAIDQYRYNSCGYTQLDVTGIEYEFQGLPKTVPAGTVAIRFTDTGAELHELDVFQVKSKDSVKKIIGLSEKEQGKQIQEVASTFATQGQTSYAIADLSKPGRYGVVCHLPVGSTTKQAAEQAAKKHAKTHAQEGMYATIAVEKGATTTSAP